jgi:hypothetical protein
VLAHDLVKDGACRVAGRLAEGHAQARRSLRAALSQAARGRHRSEEVVADLPGIAEWASVSGTKLMCNN